MKELLANSQIPGGLQPIAALATAVTTTPAAGTVETWMFSTPPPSALQGAGQFRVVVGNEICLDVTQGGGTSRQIQRGVEESTITAHGVGTGVYHVLTVGGLQQYIDGQESRVNPISSPYNADPTGATDSTAAFAAAYAAGAVDIPPGTYLILGLLDISGAKDFLGTGTAAVKFLVGASGQIRLGFGGGGSGGRIGGFEVDGQAVQNVDGGAFYITGRNYVTYEDMFIHNTVRECCRIDGGQNLDFYNVNFGALSDSARTEVPLIFDGGCGGMNFYGCEPAGGYRIQQTGISGGGYPSWVGPSDIHWHGGRTEFPTGTKPMVYHAAGSNTSLRGFGVAGSTPSLVVMEPGAQNYPLNSSAITAWDGANNITVADATGVTGLMSAKVPNTPPETIVTGVSGSVVTISNVPSTSPVGGTAQFGARCFDLSVYGPNGVSGGGSSNAFDLRGGCTLSLIGRSHIQNHLNAFLMRHTDQVYLCGATPWYASVTNVVAQQQAGDTGTFSPDLLVLNTVDGVSYATTRSSPHRPFIGQRAGDGNPHFVVTPGTVSLSDGASYPQNVGLQYQKDLDGTEHAYIIGQSTRTQYRSTVVGDGTTFIRGSFRGMLNGVGPPSTNNQKVGDWCVDTNGTVWVLLTSGTPDTWVSPSDRWTFERSFGIAPVAAYNGATYILAQDSTCFYGIKAFNNGHAQNDGFAWYVDLSAGTWNMQLLAQKASSYAIATIDISFDAGSTWTSIGTTDLYAAAGATAAPSFSGIVIPRTGHHLLRFRALTKNASSTSYYLALSGVSFRRTA